MKDDRVYLQHILDAIGKIESYTVDGQETFVRSLMAQDAVIRNFEIIGEATKQLSSQVRKRQPDIPWQRIAGFRDVLIHNYAGVDVGEVWNVVIHNLPPLKLAVNELLEA